MQVLSEIFSYPFLLRAVTVGSLVSLCAALLGVSLVLKRYSMIGDGLSHVGFGALAIASAMNLSPLQVSIPIVVIAALFLLHISETSKIKADAAIALIATSSLAVGVMIICLSGGMNTDVNNYMFGSILAISAQEVVLSVVLAIAVITVFILFYSKIFAVTFDETFASASGARTGMYKILLSVLTALVIVLGMRMMGALLISSLIIFPALTSMRVCRSFLSVTITSCILSVICFIIGMLISVVFSTPSGASIVVVNIGMFVIFYILGKILKRD